MVARSDIYETEGSIAGVSDPSYFTVRRNADGTRTGVNTAASAWREIAHKRVPHNPEGDLWALVLAASADDWRRTSGLAATQKFDALESPHIDN